MEFCTLASGSSGNAIFVRSETTAIMIDAGISAKRLTESLLSLSVTPDELSAILITHEHSDHIGGLPVFTKKCPARVMASIGTSPCLKVASTPFEIGDRFTVGDLDIRTFSTSHDAADSVGYRIDCDGASLGVLTDTGFVTNEAKEWLLGVDALILEANYDSEMLQNGPYPAMLKRRIASRHGHLSNKDCAAFALLCVKNGTNDILLAHLSAENNTPDTAAYTVGRALQGYPVRLGVAPRSTVSEVHICKKSPSFALEN